MARSGQAPLGYRRKYGRFVVDPDEAKICREMFELFIEHGRLKTVADILNLERGYRTRTGSYISSATIKRTLTNDRIVGIPGEYDAIIGRDLFDKCQTILTQNQSKTVSRKPRHVFAGRTFCYCGGKMLVRSKSNKYTCKQCKEKILSKDLEAIFVDQISGHENVQLKELSRRWYDLSLEDKISIVRITTKKIEVDEKRSQIVVTFLDI